MVITALMLTNFRNYASAALRFTAPVAYVLGDNAQGKTNLLEALYLLGRGHSFRTSTRAHLVRWACESAQISAQAEHDGLQDDLVVTLHGARRHLRRNGKPSARTDLQWPQVILFAPEETLLFKGAPEARRDYLDTLIEGMDPAYRTRRIDYERVLKQRNQILRGAWEQPRAQVLAQLEPWTAQLVRLGGQLVRHRTDWVQRLQALLPEVHTRFAAVDGELTLHYHPHVQDAAYFGEILSARMDEEIARGLTVAGPHRDDLSAQLAGQDLRSFGSQGQHRSVVLTLKLAEIALARTARGRAPLLLLDDVASELDPARGRAFFHALTACDCQIVLTTTHADGFVPALVAGAQRVVVENGALV